MKIVWIVCHKWGSNLNSRPFTKWLLIPFPSHIITNSQWKPSASACSLFLLLRHALHVYALITSNLY